MNMNSEYNESFYEKIHQTAADSASVVVPIVMNLLSPKSVIDVGCGIGTWLAEFLKQGTCTISGIDADYVDTSRLVIPKESFRYCNLSKSISLNEKFDLAVCLEVAEHLPPQMSSRLIEQLTSAAPAVLFSAAIPGQGGTAHINEQWHSFWHSKFAERGYECFDVVRPAIFACERVSWWYRQNIFIYALADTQCAKQLRNQKPTVPLEILAPHIAVKYQSLTQLIRQIPPALVRAVRNRFVR